MMADTQQTEWFCPPASAHRSCAYARSHLGGNLQIPFCKNNLTFITILDVNNRSGIYLKLAV
jgi:hypothetical protein